MKIALVHDWLDPGAAAKRCWLNSVACTRGPISMPSSIFSAMPIEKNWAADERSRRSFSASPLRALTFAFSCRCFREPSSRWICRATI